ncbi:GNAT family N-acetyltransferase [Hyalangium sp.]|uniref:GNAT family N-acetyltransferase n=1 Tax=Hyalangium sp. TaxID=2028555 RepID=UPI002D692A85|nr:GNAT family N-acetyltransferase [Hyalangium sp.]HYH94457.1 GNAT family N-acetyltransferase [Hyalangium sp.]
MIRPHPLGPTLETERLLLRPPAAEDFEAWAAFAADERVAQALGGVQSRPMAWRNMCTMIGAWAVNGFSMFSVIEKATGRWLGRLGPWRPEGWPCGEFACSLVADAWGKGYALEASSVVIDWMCDTLGWTEILHCIEHENFRAQSLARRLGAKRLPREGVLPEPFGTQVEIWGQTREEWRARRP